MNKVTKAIIPIAGYGSRMFPETLLINKALLPIGNKPVILFLLEEIVESGIKDVYIIISPNQASIIDLLKPTSKEIIDKFKDNIEIKHFNDIINSVNFHYVIQNKPNGLARALLLLKNEITEPFALLLGDNIILPKHLGIPYLKEQYEKYKVNIIGVSNIEKNDISKYGVVISNDFNNPIEVIDFIEKPTNANSTFVSLGRYVLNSSIFNYIESEKESLKELLLPNYIIKEKTLAFDTKALWLDVGNKENFRKANSFNI